MGRPTLPRSPEDIARSEQVAWLRLAQQQREGLEIITTNVLKHLTSGNVDPDQQLTMGGMLAQLVLCSMKVVAEGAKYVQAQAQGSEASAEEIAATLLA